MTVARQIAELVVGFDPTAAEKDIIHWGKVALIDTMGVTLTGVTEDGPQFLREVVGAESGRGQCTVLGTKLRASQLEATLLNAHAAHAIDFDNTAPNLAGHTSGPILPALIAAGEVTGASGRDILIAHAVGFETATRLILSVNMHHFEKGWHPTATMGVFGVATAVARMLGFTVDETERAIGIAASLASGIKANFGTMTKPLHAGHCARDGLLAALIAKKGFTSRSEVFEHRQGFFNVYNGPGLYDADKQFENWGNPLTLVSPGAAYKMYPCCAGTDSSIQASLSLVRQHGLFKPGEIEKIEVWSAARRLVHTDRANPVTPLDGKFSLQYCVAHALMNGKVVLESFEEKSIQHPDIKAVLPRVTVAPYTTEQFPANNHQAGEVKVTLKNGTVLSEKVAVAQGKSVSDPVPDNLVRAKFDSCSGRVLNTKQSVALWDAMQTFETLADVRSFTKMMEPA